MEGELLLPLYLYRFIRLDFVTINQYVNGDVAKYLVDNGVRFIGIDTINADQTGGTEFPVHDLFSEKRLMIGENWAFFDQIDFERPYVIALPMKLIGCDGSPVRAIAVQWEEE